MRNFFLEKYLVLLFTVTNQKKVKMNFPWKILFIYTNYNILFLMLKQFIKIEHTIMIKNVTHINSSSQCFVIFFHWKVGVPGFCNLLHNLFFFHSCLKRGVQDRSDVYKWTSSCISHLEYLFRTQDMVDWFSFFSNRHILL